MELVMFEPWVKNTLEGIEYKIPELRDLFAMQAISGLMVQNQGMDSPEFWDFDTIANIAYKAADAMLKARAKK